MSMIGPRRPRWKFVLLCAMLLLAACGHDTRKTAGAQRGSYPVHRGVTATVFWIGEPETADNDYITNVISAWDDRWMEHYGGYDDPVNRNGFFPAGFVPRENPFYLDLPYNDFTDNGRRKPNASRVVYWAGERAWGERESMLKNRWVRLSKDGRTCYGQWEDAGPFLYDDARYVFGEERPKNRQANSAGLDVSPALRDCLGFDGLDNAENRVDWQFVDEPDVPDGPWKQIVTTSGVTWLGE